MLYNLKWLVTTTIPCRVQECYYDSDLKINRAIFYMDVCGFLFVLARLDSLGPTGLFDLHLWYLGLVCLLIWRICMTQRLKRIEITTCKISINCWLRITCLRAKLSNDSALPLTLNHNIQSGRFFVSFLHNGNMSRWHVWRKLHTFVF